MNRLEIDYREGGRAALRSGPDCSLFELRALLTRLFGLAHPLRDEPALPRNAAMLAALSRCRCGSGRGMVPALAPEMQRTHSGAPSDIITGTGG